MSVFKDKILLITGGTGSFGNAVLNRFLRTDIGEIRIFSRDEKKQDDMRHYLQAQRPDVFHKVKFYIGNVRQREAVDFAMGGVDYVFSAAALKQDYDRHMAGAREEADQLMKSALESANRRCDAIIGDAKAQADGMLRRAESEIAQERVKAFSEVKKELSGMAVDIAEQMVSRELNAKDQDKLVDEFIRNAGDKA